MAAATNMYATFQQLNELLEQAEASNRELLVNAEPFFDFNFAAGGYLDNCGSEYEGGFRVFAEANYITVAELEPASSFGIVHGEAYSFAMPYDGQIEYLID